MAGAYQAACLDGRMFVVRLGCYARCHLVLDIRLPAIDAFLKWLTHDCVSGQANMDKPNRDGPLIGQRIVQYVHSRH